MKVTSLGRREAVWLEAWLEAFRMYSSKEKVAAVAAEALAEFDRNFPATQAKETE